MANKISDDQILENTHDISNSHLICEFSGSEIESFIYDDKTDGRSMADIADCYRIYKNTRCVCGLIVYAKYNNKWVANPWNLRSVIQYLLKKSELWPND